uniref:Tantalus-like domain-containing protein n=1 Tax=Mola mola TaxID=94237 RepID=A0A3Q3XGI9_MOLML
MLTRPLTRKDGDDGGLGLVVVSSHPSLPLDNEADDDDETQTGEGFFFFFCGCYISIIIFKCTLTAVCLPSGLFFPPAPAWHSSSSSSSSPSPPPCASSSPPAHSQTASPTFHSPSPLTPPAARSSPDLSFSSLPVSPSPSSACPPTPVAPTLLSAASSTPFPSSTSLFSPLSPFPAPKSLLPPAPHCHGGSSSLFILPPLVLPSSVSSSTPVSTIPTPSSVSPPISSLCISLSSSSPPVHPPFHLLPPSVSSPYLVCNPTPPTLAVSTSIPRPSPHDTPPPAFYTPCPPPSSSSPPVPSTLFSPPSPSFSQFPTAPSVLPPAPPPCCHCSSLLPRLLSAHRLEIRRLLRGAVASLGRRLDSLERRSSRKMRKKRSGHRGGEEGGREVCSRGEISFPLSSFTHPLLLKHFKNFSVLYSFQRGKRVSQIRIRRAPPRETSLTPMGLPKVKRLKKKEFSLEEIYTNKNYKSPNTNRSLETIFEEPRGKDGELLRIGHQRRRRLLLFPDFTQPRKRKRPQGAGLPVTTVPRKRAAARRNHGSSTTNDESDLDVMLVERLSALEDFLMRQGLDV